MLKLHSLFLIDLYKLVVCLRLSLVFRFRKVLWFGDYSKDSLWLELWLGITWQAKYSLMQSYLMGLPNFLLKPLATPALICPPESKSLDLQCVKGTILSLLITT